ncbi:MAG: cation transporter [Sphingobacteriales bacterium]|nr:cation transporter [Sphingobacteriales bacterium]MBI3719647.1 cation transporter [Sphingobacteriales bacterium]
MKHITTIVLLLIVSATTTAQLKKATLQASGLTCSLCAKSINKALSGLDFVDKVTADIKTSSFIITFKDGADADADLIRKKVEGAGFSVAKLQFTGDFNNVAIKNDAHVKLGDKTYHFLNVKEQVLNGEQTITLIDKNFVSSKDFKKYSALTKMECYKTGMAGNCCSKETGDAHARIYHVTL